MAGDAYERVATTLDFIFRYYSQIEGGKKELDLPLPHRLIGSMTGLSRETVTLQILKMAKKGIITTKNRRIKLMSEEKLQAATGR
jgi:CRP-like cAMP-binding protein